MKKLLLLLPLLALLSCTSVIDKKINPETIPEDVAKIKKEFEGTYSSEDYEAIAGILMQKAFNKALAGETLEDKNALKIDKTYREVLDEAKSNRIEFEKKMTEYENAISNLLKKLEFKVVSNDLQTDEYGIRKQLELAFEIINISGKDIKGFEGSLLVSDMFDNEITKLGINITDAVENNTKVTTKMYWDATIERSVEKVASEKLENLKMKFFPQTIVYTDGTKDTAPEYPER